MGNKNSSNVLLVEILIAVLFFMLSATVLVQVFAASRQMTVRADAETRALAEAQNVAEALYASEDADALLSGLGFLKSHGAWSKEFDAYSIYVEGQEVPAGTGTYWEGTVKGFYKQRAAKTERAQDEEVFSLPVVRYFAAEEAPAQTADGEEIFLDLEVDG